MAATEEDPTPSGIIGLTVSYDQMAAYSQGRGNRLPLYTPTPIDANTFNEPKWKTLPLTKHLGLPLLYQKIGEQNMPANQILQLLTTNIDPQSNDFGKPMDTCNCEIVLAREDGSQLTKLEVFALRAYTLVVMRSIMAFGPGQRSKEEAEAAVNKVTEHDFAVFLEAAREWNSERG